MNERYTRGMTLVLTFAFFLFVELMSYFTDPFALVSVSTMFTTLWELLLSGKLNSALYTTGSEIVVSYILAIVTGSLVGALLWKFSYLHEVLEPYLVSYYAIPIFAFYPLFIAIFGLNQIPIILIAWLYALIIIAVNVREGLAAVPDIYIKAGKSFNMSRSALLTKIYIPAALPYIFSGLRLGLIFTVVAVIASEFILAQDGLGHFIASTYESFQTAEMYAGMLLVLILSLVTTFTLYRIESTIHHGGVP